MVNWDVTVGGTSVDALQDVKLGSADDGTLGTARITAGNTSANRAIDYSQEATVTRAGSTVYTGPVTKKPTQGRKAERIEFTIADKRAELKYIEAHRPFYEMDPGAILRQAVSYRARPTTSVQVHDGSTTTNWSCDAPEFGTVGAQGQQLQKRGSDVLGVGFPEGTSGTFQAVFSGVPSAAIPGDGQVLRLTTRLLANAVGDQFQAEVELTDNSGNTYVWPIERLDTNFREYTFAAEDATSSASVGSVHGVNGTLVYRFGLKGKLPENRAVAIDYADVLPFSLTARSASVTTGSVEDVGTTITRRFDDNVMSMLAGLGQEFGHTSWVDESDVLHFEPRGSDTSPVSISYASTPVVQATFNRDSDQVVNKVTVQGGEDANGQRIQVTAQDNASIQYYGLSERENQIVDKQLQTTADARRKAEGYLHDHAWSDTAMSFRVADGSYVAVRVGEAISVTWPPEGITTETFVVSSLGQEKDGTVTVGLTGRAI